MSSRSIEEVRAVSSGRLWFQVYAWRDRSLIEEMVERSAAAGYEALVLTVDTAVLGRRERDVRRGFSMPPQLGLGTVVDGALHPAWTWSFLRSEPVRFANVAGKEVGDGATPTVISEYIREQFDPALSWSDVDWLRSIWDGPVLLKGIGRVEDAVRAADAGVDGVVLSNHGGRQLDGAPATFSLIAPVRDAIGDRCEVICDGGVRRGSDIVKAVAAGATAAMGGRAWLWGLAAGGQRGIERMLEWQRADLARTMALLGVTAIDELDPSLLDA
jgi:L-lactate dehydrogenase (cytochrome)